MNTVKPASDESGGASESPKSPVKKGVASGDSAVKRPVRSANRRRVGVAKSAGGRLRAELGHRGDSVGVQLLIRQAARVADRLEAIDRLLSGDARMWQSVSLPREDGKRGTIRVEVRVDSLLVEERSQTTLFRHLLGEIHKQRAGVPLASEDDEDDDLVE